MLKWKSLCNTFSSSFTAYWQISCIWQSRILQRSFNCGSSLYLLLQFIIIKRRLILHTVVWYTLPFFLQVYHTVMWHTLKCNYNIWSLSEATYLQMSSIWQLRIRQRSFTVFIEISLPCFSLWSVLVDIWCLLVKVYQFSFDFFNVFQNGE